MDFTELLHAFFDEQAATQLGQAAGLDAPAARRALDAALTLELEALAAQADTPAGGHIAEAIASLPLFESVPAALNEPDGASNLRQAGELLLPALLGDQAGTLAGQVAGRAGVPQDSAARLTHMTLPLLLSLLGQFGVNAGNVGARLGEVRGSLAQPGVAHVEPTGLTAGAPHVTAVTPGTAALGTAGLAALSGPALLEWLRAQFSGRAAERIGAAAGFSGGAAGRATQAALPVLLGALVQRAGSEAGARDLLDRSAATMDLVGADGTLKTELLSDPAETARVEGQGRTLIGTLFPDIGMVTGRLGSALGGSGASAGRLLALMGPLLLALLGARARAGQLDAAGVRGLLAGLEGHLPGLLPAGMTGLGALLGAGALGTGALGAGALGAATTPVTPAPAAARVPPGAATVTTSPLTTPPPPAAPASTPPERRRGFPWWLLALLLLLGLGGCWLVNQNRAATPAASSAQAASLVVTNPTSGADLPAEGFTMSGTGPANTELTISDQGQEVGKATVGADGNWSADLPAPTPGEHTYSVDGGGARSELKVNVTDASASTAADTDASGTQTGSADAGSSDVTGTDTNGAETGSTDTASTDTASTDTASAGTDSADTAGTGAAFAISEPAANATLPAGTFTLRGTGAAGQAVELFEDGTSLGTLTIGEDGAWSFDVPSPAAGAHTYTVRGPDGTDLGSVAATVSAPAADASAAACDRDYTLSITDGQTVNEPFRFGGVGQGEGYSVTVKRGARTIGTKDVPLDATCGWSYQSRPGAGRITYEVRPLGDAAAAPLSTVNLTVGR